VQSVDDVDAEVIVVDNAHPVHGHRTASRLALSTAGVRVLRPQRNLGFAGGSELGALHARGELLCFVNPDLLPHPRWFAPVLATLRENPDSIVAPRLVNADGSLQEAGQSLSTDGVPRPRIEPTTAGPSVAGPDYASAACWLMTRSLHERSGGFDPRFFPAYYEDVDLALRVRMLGGHTVIADADVIHLLGKSTADDAPHPMHEQRAILCRLWAHELRHQPVF
jgi:GT2 family glycosyltransferase